MQSLLQRMGTGRSRHVSMGLQLHICFGLAVLSHLQSYNLYEPVHLMEQMAAKLDHDVTRALMAQLGRASIEPVTAQPSAWLQDPDFESSAQLDDCANLSGTLMALMSPAAGCTRCSSNTSAEHSLALQGEAVKSLPLPASSALAFLAPSVYDTGSGRSFLSVDGSVRSPRVGPSGPGTQGLSAAGQLPGPQAPLLEQVGAQDPRHLHQMAEAQSIWLHRAANNVCAVLRSSQVEQLLAAASSSWDMDPFALSIATQGHPLSTLAYYLVHDLGLVRTLSLRPTQLARCARCIVLACHRTW